MKRHLVLVSALILAFLLAGCASTWRALIPGGVTAADAEWDGVVAGPTVPAVAVVASLASGGDQRVAALSAILSTVSQDPIGAFLPVVTAGETTPRWVLCTEKFLPICGGLSVNTAIHFAGQPIGPGILWKPVMLKRR